MAALKRLRPDAVDVPTFASYDGTTLAYSEVGEGPPLACLAGGPGRGPEYLVDSNIDWGQDVKKLLHWLDAHGTRRARVFYFGNTPMDYYGLEAPGYPAPLDQAGWDEIDDFCVANVTPLNGVYVPLDVLAPLRMREPVAKVGWSMYVYDLRKKKKN